MALLGDVNQVMKMIRPNEDASYGSDLEARLLPIQTAVSAKLEYELGRTFGTPVTDTTEVMYGGDSSALIFTRPARAITSVTVGGTVAGNVVTGGTLYPSTPWEHYPVDWRTGLIYGIRLIDGSWWGYPDAVGPAGPVVVVGDFIDSDDD